jgi:hypothetical protein
MKCAKIYVLIDPRDNSYRYIGKTKNELNRRLRGHIRSSLNSVKTKKEYWINSLIKQNLNPIIKLIEECNSSNWEDREIYWIKYYSKIYNLTNSTEGGDGIRDATGENNGMFGKKHTDKSKYKMRLKKIGVFKGDKNPMSKKLFQYSIDYKLIKVWNYAKEAAVFYKISEGNISSAATYNSKVNNNFKIRYNFIFSHKELIKYNELEFK